MQPGNNYRAGASVISHAPTQADQTKADAVNSDPEGGNFSGYKVPLTWSPMLTVWRKLTLEVDSMERESEAASIRFPGVFEQDRCAVASVTTDSLGPGFATVQCGPDPVDPNRGGFAGTNFFEGGAFWCADGGQEWLIVRSAAGPQSYTLTLWGNPGTGIVGQQCKLRDDDTYFGAAPGQLPLTTVLDDNIRRAYRDAYIEVNEAGPSLNLVNLVDWRSHLSPTRLTIDYETLSGVSYQWDLGSQDTYWVRHVVPCYQSDRDNAGDGDNEENCSISQNCQQVFAPYPVLGLSQLPQLPQRYGLTVRNEFLFDTALSTIYVETVRDQLVTPTSPVLWQFFAHETGHGTLDQAGNRAGEDAEHAEGGIMSSGTVLQNLAQYQTYTGQSIKRFRETKRW
jgi:hypothetical protein